MKKSIVLFMLALTILFSFHSTIIAEDISSPVITGKDNWLYFRETLNDFTGNNTLKEISIKQIVKTLELMNEYANSKGSTFYFTIAPNKNSIYPEYMPDQYTQGESNNYSLLKNALAHSNVKFIDLKAFLLDEKPKVNDPFYSKTDTHWNNLGALKAYRYIACNISTKTNIQANALLNDIPLYTKEKTWSGDLYRMLAPEGEEKDDELIFDIPKNYISPAGEHDFNIITTLKEDKININPGRKLLIFRDSFAYWLVKFISNDFSEVRYSRQIPYPIHETNDEIVILETVERYIPLLIKNTPIMPAPIRENMDLSNYIKLNEENIHSYKDEEDKYFHLYGYFTSNEPFQINEVLLKYNDKFFEAFPILESKIQENLIGKYGEHVANQGFSLRIPKETYVQFNEPEFYIKR